MDRPAGAGADVFLGCAVLSVTNFPAAVNQVFLHMDVCFGVDGVMLCWKLPALQGFLPLYVVD